MSILVRAAVARQKSQPLVIEELLLRDPEPGEVLIKMKASGLCHTDLSVIEGKFPIPMPVIAGHEGAGAVLALGEGVTNVAVGDHVILNNLPHCGVCPSCRTARSNFCEDMVSRSRRPSAFSRDGEPVGTMGGIASFATHTVIDSSQLSVISQGMPFASAALIPCGVMTGVGAALFTVHVEQGSKVIVFGLGSIGLNVIQAARLAGASRIVAIDTNPAKEAMARQFGATDFVNPRAIEEPVIKHLTALLGGLADYSFECVGSVDLVAQALALVNPYWGSCVAVGIAPFDQQMTLPATAFWFGRTLRGTLIGGGNPVTDTRKVIDWYDAGDLRIDELVTHRFTLDQINEGFEVMKRGEAIRSVILY